MQLITYIATHKQRERETQWRKMTTLLFTWECKIRCLVNCAHKSETFSLSRALCRANLLLLISKLKHLCTNPEHLRSSQIFIYIWLWSSVTRKTKLFARHENAHAIQNWTHEWLTQKSSLPFETNHNNKMHLHQKRIDPLRFKVVEFAVYLKMLSGVVVILRHVKH